MRKYILFVLLSVTSNCLYAQAPFATIDSIDANLITTSVLVHGDMFWNPQTSQSNSFFPSGTRKNINFASALWMSAYDNSGQLHVSAQTYRQDGNDYWPGPLDESGMLDYATSEKWAKIWKVRRSEVITHLSNAFRNVSNTPQSILTWPAKGNVYARGKDGAVLNITEEMAPFVDRNGDGIYQPLGGDYPDFNGEQVLWWVFSDNGPTHSQTNGLPLKAQVYAMAYAFKRNTLIDQVVYFDYTVINKSPNNYNDMRVGLWNDVALAYYLDDYIGFDSTWRMGICYNGRINDGGAGHPANSYGINPPATGVTLVHLPGDNPTVYVPAGSFMYNNNDPSIYGNPNAPIEYDNYMRSRFRNGVHLKYNPDSPSVLSSGMDRQYAFPDDPSLPNGWNECTIGSTPGDRRFIISSNDFSLLSGTRTKFVIASLVDSLVGGCPFIPSFNKLRILADTAWNIYNNSVSVNNTTKSVDRINLYPNPADNIMHIEGAQGALTIRNAVGQQMFHEVRSITTRWDIDVSQYPSGMYVAIINDDGVTRHAVFVKK